MITLSDYTPFIHHLSCFFTDGATASSTEPARDRERGPAVPVVVGVGAGLAAVPLVVAVGVLVWMKLCRRIPTPPPSPRRHSTLSKDAASTALPSEGSPHRDPDLLSHTTGELDREETRRVR